MDNKILHACLVILCAALVQQIATKDIPNPFEVYFNGYFLLRGNQIISTSHGLKQNISFESYLELEHGTSYTTYLDNNNLDDLGYAILTDTARTGRIYVIRNPKGRGNVRTECELDNVHNHKHVFPWMFDKILPTHKIASIYGPFAVWLHMIMMSKAYPLHHEQYDGADNWYWYFGESEIYIQLAFNSTSDKPEWFKVSQGHVIEPETDSATANQHQTDLFEIDSFERIHHDNQKETWDLSNHLNTQWRRCQWNPIRHRIFPSLNRYLARSPIKAFYINYDKITYPSFEQANSYTNDQNYHRPQFENVIEVLSLKEEAQYVQYNSMSGDTIKSDTYLKLFSKDLVDKPGTEIDKSIAHSATAYYHIFETKKADQSNQESGCFEGEREPLIKYRIFNRPIHLKYLGMDLKGHLSGLIALLLNAADIHHKEFDLGLKRIKVPVYSDYIYADEWIIHDNSTLNIPLDIHFYFGHLETIEQDHPNENSIERLVMIDIRNATISIETSAQNATGDHNLLMRLYIRQSEWDFKNGLIKLQSYENIQQYFRIPEECVHTQDDSSDYESADEAYEDDIESIGSMVVEVDSDEEGEYEHQEIDGLGFELDHGTISEYNRNLPNHIERPGAREAYEVVSELRLGLVSTSDATTDTGDDYEKIFIRELTDLELGVATISVYLSEYKLAEDKPKATYHLRYSSDAVFVARTQVVPDLIMTPTFEHCEFVDDVDPFLRLLSMTHDYRIDLPDTMDVFNKQDISIHSDRLRVYGVGALWLYASSSTNAEKTVFEGKGREASRFNDGSKYLPLHWTLKEMDMDIRFGFFYNVTRHKENESSGKNHTHHELLHLDTIAITGLPNEHTQFKPVQIKILKLRTNLQPQPTTLPSSCKFSISAAEKAIANRYKHLLTMPKFEYYAYHASYRHTSLTGSVLNRMNITEIFDGHHRGWIKLESDRGNGTIQMFIDREKDVVFDYEVASKACVSTKIDQKSLELIPGFSCDIDKFNSHKPFGLAALWLKLTREPVKTYVEPLTDGKQIVIYRTSFPALIDEGDTNDIEVHCVAKHTQRASVGLADSSEVKLRYILSKHRNTSNNHIVIMDIDAFGAGIPPSGLPELPESCVKLIGRGEEPPSSPIPIPTGEPEDRAKYAEEFPPVTPLLKNRFMMRSGIAIRYPSNEQPTTVTYLLDEWYDHQDGVRLQSYDFRGKNMDLLIYPETNEYFDLSNAYKCENNRIPVLIGGREFRKASDSPLARFWSHDKAVVDHPSDLYYGAMGLWRLAENNREHIELLKAGAPECGVDGSSAPCVSRAVWRLNIPQQGWSFELQTAKLIFEDKTWPVLERATVYEDGDNSKQYRVIDIDVVNYHDDYSLIDSTVQFLLPEGSGCERSDTALDKMSQEKDVFDLDVDHGYKLSYEATLEIVKQNESGSSARQLLPTFSGEVVQVGRTGKRNFDVSGQIAHINHVHEATSKASRKIVATRTTGFKYDIDLISGSCLLEALDHSSHSEETYFVLEFPAEDEHGLYLITVPISTRFNKKFWFDESKDRILNRVAFDNHDYSTYEQFYEYPAISEKLRGRVSVIRTFVGGAGMTLTHTNDGRSVRKHSELHTKVMIFDESRSILKAVLNLRLYRQPKLSTSDLLQFLSVTECFNNQRTEIDRRVRSYKISYPQVDADSLVDVFYEKLIDTFDLDLNQLDDQAHVSSNHRDEVIEIHFNVWEPSFFEHFIIHKNCTMYKQLEYAAESEPVQDSEDCFRLCQLHFDCVAMNYCEEDRICMIIPQSALKSQYARFKDHLKISQPKRGCVYYYRRNPDEALFSLENFTYVLDQYVNSVRSPDQLDTLALRVGDDNYVKPVKFEDLTDEGEIEEWHVEDAIYREQVDYKLDLKKLNQLNKEKGAQFEAHRLESKSIGDCMSECRDIECIYLSHCKNDQVCTLLTNGSDIRLLRTTFKVEADKSEGCIVAARDFSLTYDLYDNTIAPIVNDRRLDDCSLAECASICQYDDICLSFDHCQSSGTTDDEEFEEFCLLQSDHMAMDNIQRDILGQSLQDKSDQFDDTYCRHYSKSMLSNFERVPNARFKKDRLTYQTIRGLSGRRCAAICIQDECDAFEHCFHGKRRKLQSCRFLKRASNETNDAIDTNVIGTECSVYDRTRGSMQESLQHTLDSDSLIDKKVIGTKHVSGYWVYPIYLFIAIAVGSIVQVIYTRIKGQPLVFS